MLLILSALLFGKEQQHGGSSRKDTVVNSRKGAESAEFRRISSASNTRNSAHLMLISQRFMTDFRSSLWRRLRSYEDGKGNLRKEKSSEFNGTSVREAVGFLWNGLSNRRNSTDLRGGDAQRSPWDSPPYDRWRTGASRGNSDQVLEIDPGSLLEIWSM
jgi:hypothetical protein